MSAKKSDDGRVAEIYRVICETESRIKDLKISKDKFLNDDSVQGRNLVDGIFMCIYRVTEEAGQMSQETKEGHPEIPWRAIYGMRNIFAHDYGKVDRTIVWGALTTDLPCLKDFCKTYANEHGIELL